MDPLEDEQGLEGGRGWLQASSLVPKLIALALIYATTLCVYRLFFHPFARFPGPPLAKITTLHSAYYAWKGTIREDILQSHEKYGRRDPQPPKPPLPFFSLAPDIGLRSIQLLTCQEHSISKEASRTDRHDVSAGKYVRYAPDRVLFNSAQAVSDIYSHKANTIKSKTYLMLAQQAANSLTMRDKALHGKRRRVVSQAFSDATMRTFEPRIIEKIERLSGVINKSLGDGEWSETNDMGRYCEWNLLLGEFQIADAVNSGA